MTPRREVVDLIPLSRAWLCLWPVDPISEGEGADNTAPPPKLGCRFSDGPLLALEGSKPAPTMKQQMAIAWLKARKAREVPVHDAASLRRLWDAYSLSPGWADEAAAWAEFKRIDQRNHELLAQWQADMERRKRLTIECRDWREAARVLHKAGEIVTDIGRVAA